ncbi:S41 family peptidase [Jeotgalibacillus salarius]|uniref:Tail specific protease domain-containing protein n=1 Tax=Jeotgalibacillus salarius TaxID=546023 RepID=A0A4Y8L9W5_9BACL|nr:S41 family peptidase [Jeotgalibacillus salarius]TFD99445.1 hypothetical protein E2626_14395 [Jeotgalibacillus salarius]
MYVNMFEEIADVMHHDYSGFLDKKGWDQPDLFREQVEALNPADPESRAAFTAIVNDYLLDFRDKHVSFTAADQNGSPSEWAGFRVRRYREFLYITESKDTRFQIGDKIISVDGESIPQASDTFARKLYQEKEARQDWNPVMLSAGEIEVEKSSGERAIYEIHRKKKPVYTPEYSSREIGPGIHLIKLTDFGDPDAVYTLFKKHEESYQAAKALIFDVRVNYGGSDSSYYPFIPFIFGAEEVDPYEMSPEMLFNCTEKTAHSQLEELKETLKVVEEEETRKILKFFEEQWQEKRGSGFQRFPFEKVLPMEKLSGHRKPEQIFILSDLYCGSSGDSFVETSKWSEKVTVIGRPTMGINDYSNVASLDIGEGFTLGYPTSKLVYQNPDHYQTGRGIEPDVYIEWRPEHLERDVDLEAVMDRLKSVT